MLPFKYTLIAVILQTGSCWAAGAEPLNKTPPLQCGHYAIMRCCQLLGIPADSSTVVRYLPPKEAGHSMLDLTKALVAMGLRASGFLENYGALLDGVFPVIAHTRNDHYVVVQRANHEFVWLLEADGRPRVSTAKHFQDEWDGKLLRVSRKDGVHSDPNCSAEQGARIQFGTLLIDKGELPPQQEAVEYDFAFRNVGTAELIVEKIETSCSCLGAEKPDRPIPPGESGHIRLRYRPNTQGSFLQTARLHSNDPCHRVIELVAAGNTEHRIVVDPPSFELGKIVRGQRSKATCLIKPLGDLPCRILEAKADLDCAELDVTEVTDEVIDQLRSSHGIRGLARNAHVLTLSIRSEQKPVGGIHGTIRVKTTAKGFEEITIPVSGEIVAPVVLRPTILYFGEVAPGDDVSGRTTVMTIGPNSFRIRSITGLRELKCSYPSSSGLSQAAIVFSGKGHDVLEMTGATIEVAVETQDHQQLTLPISIYAQPRPR